ncbi:NACHT domain-containing protein [Streptomyces sp. NPDC048253]|uniref:NACHT domain-containing protein n=1 Tax=Streptomyces sp. NPDC048253 TaxID=3365524 RepID=UPI00371BCEBC
MTTTDRIAAVFGAQQGTGYLLTPRLVLTANHLIREGSETVVIAPGGLGKISCHAIWVGVRECSDVALLLADAPLVAPESADASKLSLGEIQGLAPVLDCYAIGFPRVQRYDGERLDVEQFVGTIKPGSQSVRGNYVIDSVYTSPSALKGGGSPWAGMSGAPLFSGRHLIGVVIVDAAGWQHSRLAAVPIHRLHGDADFSNIYRQHVGAFRVTPLLHTPDSPAAFEHRYRTYIEEVHGELTIFGLDFSRPENAQWPLDSAYISLELVRREGEDDEPDHSDPSYGDRGPHTEERARVESALHGARRVLLRGLAGSGKTTMMQWLAVTAARNSFGDQLAHLRDRVPFMLPMRTLIRGASLPAAGDLISAAGHPLTPPEGWVDAVLTEGRGLILIDGVDEMLQEDRTRTREWLFKLLAAYPDNVVVVTTRPTAVDDGWLSRKGFTEFQLLPMNQRDITEFVRRWYKSASSLIGTDKRAQLDAYRDQLLDTLPRKRDLARLATNPLMCAMICALQRDRKGYLPDSRMKLYEAALTMLLVRRDQERDVAGPEGLEVSEEAQQKLLQEIAYWMIRNGLAEAEQQQVIDLIGKLLPAMPQVGTPEQAPDIFRVLLHRSGLLRVPAPETVGFVHRTFLDYLGARAAVEAQDINLVAAHAAEPQWEDTVRMAVGHARDKERASLLEKLVEMGDNAADSARHLRVRLHLLAAASLEHATSLSPETRAKVEQRAAALVPPKDTAEATQLAEAGPIVLDLLPGPAGLSDEEAAAVVMVAATIRGDHALQLLQDYRDHPSETVREALVRSWSSFDAATYATNVLAPMRTNDVWITISTAEELAALPTLGKAHKVAFQHSLSPENVVTAAHAVEVRNMVVSDNPRLRSLTPLSEVKMSLTTLVLDSCESVRDYSAAAELALESINLTRMPASPTLSALRSATTLRRITLDLHGDHGRLRTLPLPAQLVHLSLSGNCTLLHSLDGVEQCHHLESLRIDTDPFVIPDELRRLESLSELRELTCNLRSFTSLTGNDLPILTTVTKLILRASVDTDSNTADLRRIFPRLQELHLNLKCNHPVSLDVTALAGIPATTIHVAEGPMRLPGAELLPAPPTVPSGKEGT